MTSTDIAPPTRLGQSAWQRTQLPARLGCCFTDTVRLDDGLRLFYIDYAPACELRETSHLEREGAALSLTVALEGQSATFGTDGQRFDFVAGHSTLAAFASVRGERRFPAQQPIRQLRLIAEAPLLHKYGLGSLIRGVAHDYRAKHLSFGKHTLAVRRLAESLIRSHDRWERQASSMLDLQIAALNLLSEHTRYLQPPAPSNAGGAPSLNAQDQDKILRVRDILMGHFDRALTVAYLCAAVGTNEFKLKQGFRQLFGTSVHRMLTDIRMGKARELLETGLNAAVVAYRVGYQHPASFSTAFARYYGCTPKAAGGLGRR
ncbi:helix-turn-helix transcriptional regulator [Cephaloticoccus primus]|uniref:helix-turn-helix transcriptional regulator n=1 Tax=Cephaloticoccus primus TaxID=1548207 RepID=UPI0018D30EFF|nr:AraC family transcriptional regulator [Cephaloticoccus primus]